MPRVPSEEPGDVVLSELEDPYVVLENIDAEVQLPDEKSRGLGWVKDEYDERDYKANALLGAPRSLPAEASLEGFVRRVRNQVGSMCVGMAIAMALDVRLRKMGFDPPEPAPMSIYSLARILARKNANESLRDEGSMARYAMKGLRDVGVIAEERWPMESKLLCDELPWDVLQQASAFRVKAWHRIVPSGMGRVPEICNALRQGYPVVFAAHVDTSFMDHMGRNPVPTYDPGKEVGGHMMCIVGFTTKNGRIIFRCVNSWGEEWGDKGFFWAEDLWIAADTVDDVYVIEIGMADEPAPKKEAA